MLGSPTLPTSILEVYLFIMLTSFAQCQLVLRRNLTSGITEVIWTFIILLYSYF